MFTFISLLLHFYSKNYGLNMKTLFSFHLEKGTTEQFSLTENVIPVILKVKVSNFKLSFRKSFWMRVRKKISQWNKHEILQNLQKKISKWKLPIKIKLSVSKNDKCIFTWKLKRNKGFIPLFASHSFSFHI